MEIRSLTKGPLAAEVLGLDLREGITDAQMARCIEAFCAHHVLVIRDQTLSAAEYLAFGQQWGQPTPHVLDQLRMDGVPEIMQVGNIGTTAKGEKVHHGADYWHTDQSYDANPVTATMLYALLVPARGGETQFANLTAAFEALPKDTQHELEPLIVDHRYGAASGGKVAVISNEQATQVPPVQHPLVRVHPLSGRRSLYAITGTPEKIQGKSQTESDALLTSLRHHALQERFIYRHPYRVGDIAIWDTTATLHAATTIPVAERADDRRLLWRISVRGKPRLRSA